MTREEWQKAYEPFPERLDECVTRSLARLEEAPAWHFSLKTAAIALAVFLALCGVALAAFESRTAEIFGRFYGDEKKQELLSGDTADVNAVRRLGDVIYTLDDAVYMNGTIYASGTIRPADEANIILIAEDVSVNDPVGALLFWGETEEIPENAPSYAEAAHQQGAKIVLAHAVANGVLDENGQLNASEIGYGEIPQEDGTIRFFFEFSGSKSEIERVGQYDVSLYITNWEVTPDGVWLCGEGDNTRISEDWTITIKPEMQEE